MTNVVVAGGDPRDRWLCHTLVEQGFNVQTWGMSVEGFSQFDPDHPDVSPNLLIGPMTGIDETGSMDVAEGSVRVTDAMLVRMGDEGVIAAGLVSPVIQHRAHVLGIRTIEYRKESSFMWLNAVPTAEGAVKDAIGRSGRTLYDRPLAILGFGRVGSVLALRLQAYGARITVYDRSLEKRAMARAYGFRALPLSELPPHVDGIFNTIPAPVLDERWVSHTHPAWIIDLASIPGGLTPSVREAVALSDRYQWTLGIPGKIAPIRAAEIIWETLELELNR